MRNTNAVPAFLRFSKYFFQGVFGLYADPRVVVADALAGLSSSDLSIVKDYLLKLLASGAGDGELATVWSSCDSDYDFGGRGTRAFFQLILETEPKLADIGKFYPR